MNMIRFTLGYIAGFVKGLIRGIRTGYSATVHIVETPTDIMTDIRKRSGI